LERKRMAGDIIRTLIGAVDKDRLSRDVFYLSKDPLPFRKLNYTVPGHAKCTLYEADDFIQGQLESAGWPVEKEPVQVQAFRCDTSKPKAHQYSPPPPEDPWYTAYNLYAKRKGRVHPDEIIVLCAHKDSQSWVDSPGAHDNATGTSGLIEVCRCLADYEPQRSVWFLFCNEEHSPWTSVTAARRCRERGDNVVAVLNCDGFGARTAEETAADRKAHGMCYTNEEGRALAELMVRLNGEFSIGLDQTTRRRDWPGDDDGSFVNAGYLAALFTGGTANGEYPTYHRETDMPETVDFDTVRRITQVTLATVLRLDVQA
jgi:hypothetical protein